MSAKGTRQIGVTFSTVDHYSESRRFTTLEGARRYAQRKIGKHPDLGTTYAVDNYGVAKIVVSGATLTELFPDEMVSGPDHSEDRVDEWR